MERGRERGRGRRRGRYLGRYIGRLSRCGQVRWKRYCLGRYMILLKVTCKISYVFNPNEVRYAHTGSEHPMLHGPPEGEPALSEGREGKGSDGHIADITAYTHSNISSFALHRGV